MSEDMDLPKGANTNCPTGKIGWPSKSRAHKALKACSKRRRAEERVYECPECHQWHLTRQGDETVPTRKASKKKGMHVAHSQGMVFDYE